MSVFARNLLFSVRRPFAAWAKPIVAAPGESIPAEASVAWLRDYIGQPHPDLGRKGDICPFVNTALDHNRMRFHVHDRVREIRAEQLSDLFIYEGLRLIERLDTEHKDAELTTVVLLFPTMDPACHAAIHDAHTRCKSTLMRNGLMIAVFYPGYDRPAIYNPSFKLYQAPFPTATIRPMALHDIVFLDRNAEGFAEYHRRFVARYRAGKVSEKFGYIERFADAEKRFNLTTS